ncbi:uncharacterized protein Z520_06538 [Fonsecaea multimorphosa CBS 102226]|uniref:Uncharacterized protein n=1 Tax=Fonsecaea multimorphosa CBS 102226 TaxID=1442371 RepID=A0A0D2H7D0_9EURO|nr:uncharacterized protein Z520_06538 [Fonsecaea multimorphosa CBS 102226]KIX97760.1 hypothetical protein Z520_06538 [Fonsecaea multimorphosa CBS 102226]OAL23780.1 hypothetical protein AYO22_06099 [Fonsecaea multimorphosa]
MSESGMHAITNGKLDKVSDGLPNGVESNDSGPVQFESVDFGLFNEKIHLQVHNLNGGMSAVKSAVEKITETFNQYGEMVKTVDERYSAGQDLEAQVQELEDRNDWLERKMGKMKQSHQVQLRNERIQLEKEISGLKSQAASGQQEKQKYEELIKALRKEHERAIQEVQKGLDLKKTQLEKDNEEHIAKLEAKNKELEKTQTTTERKLEEMTKMRDRERETRETMQSKADAEIQNLKYELASVKAKYEVQRLPVEHYAERYKELVDSVASIADEYFSELPEEAIDDPAGTYKQLKNKRSAFDTVPITQSECARVLRLAHVQNIIFNVIGETVWPLFFSRYLLKNRKDRSLINDIYSQLATDGEEIQNDWKISTLKVLDRLDNGVDVGEKIRDAIDVRVVQVLEPLLGEKNKADFGTELKKVFTVAMELSQEWRRDRSPVYFDMSPSADSGKGWKEFSVGFDVEDAPNPSLIACREGAFDPLCVSPRLYRKRETETATGGSDPVEDELVHPGVALFPSTGIFQKGWIEWQGLRDAEREMRKAYTGKARRASIASTNTGMGVSPPGSQLVRPSKTWQSPTKTEYD